MSLPPPWERARLGPEQRLAHLARLASQTFDVVVIGGGVVGTGCALDAAARGLDVAPESPTEHVPLFGAVGYQVLWNRRRQLAASSGLHLVRIEHLLGRYGVLTEELLMEIERRPELAGVLPGTDDHLQVEVWYAAAAEGALHLDDVLARRTRLSSQTFDRGLAAAEPAARIMAKVLGWDEDRIAEEVALYRGRVDAERRCQEQPDDEATDRIRRSVPDPYAALAG